MGEATKYTSNEQVQANTFYRVLKGKNFTTAEMANILNAISDLIIEDMQEADSTDER